MIDPKTWLTIQQEIQDFGSPQIKLKLETYHKRYLATCKHCWVPSARRKLAEAWDKEKAGKVMVSQSGTRYIESNNKGPESDDSGDNSEPAGDGAVDSEAARLAGLSA